MKTCALNLFVFCLICFEVVSQSNFQIEYGVAYNEIAIDTSGIDEEFKKYILKSDSEDKRNLAADRSYALLSYDAIENMVTFKQLEIMDTDDQSKISLSLKGVYDMVHDLNSKTIHVKNKRPENVEVREWQIEEYYKLILGYECQKATSIYELPNGLKKTITAWFTPDIPIPSGPSTFLGLPGLILEVDNQFGRKIYARKIKF